MDFMIGLSLVEDPSNLERKVNQVLMTVYRMSKFVILIACNTNDDINRIFYFVWERIFAIFGIPEIITTDRDKLFKLEKQNNLIKDLGCKQILSTANHQQINSQSERKI